MIEQARREGAPSSPFTEVSPPTPTEDAFLPQIMKIVHQNVNTISSDARFNQVGLILEEIKYQNIDILTMNEINVNMQEKSVRTQYKQAYHRKHRKCHVQSSWAPTPVAATKYRPGGTQVTLFGDLIHKIKATHHDTIAGSWSSTTITTKHGPLTIISAYRVSQSSLGKLGASTVYSQEYFALEANGVKNPEPRKRCLRELSRLLTSLSSNHHMILLNMDANEDILTERELFAFSQENDLIDLVATFSPHQVHTPTYSRGKKRIDYSFCSSNLLEFVQSACISAQRGVKDSDHSALVITLNKTKLMWKPTPSHRSVNRQVTQKNPESVYRYRALLCKYFQDHHILTKVKKLKTTFEQEQDINDTEKEKMLNHLDAEVTRLMIAAEKKCSKKKTFGVYHWSPALAAAGQAYSHSKTVLKEFLRSRSSDFSIACAKEDVKLCRAHLHEEQEKAATNRECHLQAIGELLTEGRNTEVRHIVNEIKKVEAAKEMARKLQCKSTKKPRTGPLDSVLIPGEEEGSWIRLEDATTIEEAVLTQNKKDLEHANRCPFLTEPLKTYLGSVGNTPGADALLDGTATPDTSTYPNSIEVDALLRHLKRITRPLRGGCPSQDAYKKLYRKMRESTASSPSGRHYGHYKAAYETSVGAQVLHQLTTLPFDHGLSLHRWQHSLHFMLQKKDLPYVNKLRIIQLFEADFNVTLKLLFSRELMQHGDKLHLHSDESFGARKGRNTHGALMIYQSTFGLAHLNKRNIAILDSDATGCYDRIPHNLLTMAQQRLGCRKSFTISHAKTLHQMRHRILTAHGVSSKSFTNMLAGVGQGSSNGPSGWHSVFEVIAAAYRELNPGCNWKSPHENIDVSVWLAGFVDDVVKFVSFRDSDKWEETLAATQASYQSWQKLLEATGGSLSLAKSSYTMLYWVPDGKNDFRLAQKAETPGTLTMTADNTIVTIKRNEPHEASKDLGIYLAPDGNMAQQFTYCLQRAKDLKRLITAAPLTRLEADTFFHSNYMGWARYFLPITTFSMRECHTIQSTVLQALTPKCGLNRHTPLAVIFGPSKYGGLARPHLWTEQAIEHLRVTTLEIRKNSKAGKLLRIELDTLQLISGLLQPILCSSFDSRLSLPQTRLSYLWHACSNLNIQVEVFSQWLPKKSVESDRSIMAEILSNEDIKNLYTKKQHIATFNKCRMFAKVITTSDLTLPNTTKLDPSIWNLTTQRKSELTWPRVRPPTPRDVALWKGMLARVFLVGNQNIKGLQLPNNVTPQPADLTPLHHPPSLFSAILHQLPPLYRHLVGTVTCPLDDGSTIVQTIRDTQCLGASDGSSVDRTLASFAVSINPISATTAFDSSDSLSATGSVDGVPGFITSLRAESRGAVAILILLLCLSRRWPQVLEKTCAIDIYFDSKITIHRADTPPTFRKDFLSLDFDLWILLRQLRHLIPFTVNFRWVASHQDSNPGFLALPPSVLANIHVDALAQTTRETLTSPPPTIRIPESELAISVNHVRYHHFPQDIIRDHQHSPPLKEYIIKKTGWTDTQFHSIDWEAYSSAFTALSPPQKVNWIKLAIGWQHTGSQQALFRPQGTQSQCPFLCGEQETPMHFCICRADLALSHKSIHLSTLTNLLTKENTCPSLRRAIITVIASVCGLNTMESFTPRASSSRGKKIIAAMNEITSLDPLNLLKGRIPTSVSHLQLEYLHRISLKPGANTSVLWRRWKKRCVTAIVEFTIAIWNDRNSVVHGSSVSHSRYQRIAHVHASVHKEYQHHFDDHDPFMDPHFQIPMEERLKSSLCTLQTWLQRVAASRVRQRLLQEAKNKIDDILHVQYIDRERILSMPNRDLSRWIKRKFVPSETSQRTIHQFFSP